jgi:ABC-2 type transport system permease protein
MREIRERLRNRAFLYSTAFLLLLTGALAVISVAYAPETTYRYGIGAPAPPGLEQALERAAEPFDAKVRLRVVGSPAAGREDLDADRIDALLFLRGDRLVFRDNVDAKVAAVADNAVRALRHRLPPAPELTAATLEPPDAKTSDAETVVAVFGSMLMILFLSIYGQWVLVGVVEEKSNRVVELVLATVRPRDLLAGKVIGIGLLGLVQLALVAGLGAILLAAGAFDAPTELGASLALVVPWFALGFALYAVAFAAAGALASRQQDAASAGQPITIALVVSYLAGYVALSADPSGTLARVFTVFPPTAPFVVPARAALDGVPAWEQALALVLVLVSIYGLVRFAGRVYTHGLLHTGARLDARAAWRLARRA